MYPWTSYVADTFFLNDYGYMYVHVVQIRREVAWCIRTLIILSPRVISIQLDGELIRARVTVFINGNSIVLFVNVSQF